MNFKCCAIIPTLNHYKAISKVIDAVKANGLDVFVIDDGSEEVAAKHISNLHAPEKNVLVIRLNRNVGKGAAFHYGAQIAVKNGYTHALQIDADGQHALTDILKLVDAANRNNNALVTAKPVYDHSIPMGRKIGRWITHVWVWIETLSFDITDSMCGYRIYPLSKTLEVLKENSIGRRMDFDTSVMVHLYWRGVDVIEIPSKVVYPEGNTSNFDVLRDNVRISWMHTKLVFGLIFRLLTLKGRRDK
ncbi:glycosyltransferase family 2 protein [Sneathiella glossodoripedis]|uniref:glycosyltransferase family 2 protein n=1 Tax=Sneathiella glossodoripedis TaxID=418853 RepID=UPI000470CBE2|nr:glycosyltransferase family 2 protein [Sneathiella glossodoripedis]